ncbi:hypothetical protein bcgnr5412_59040 [Bacillus cereus]|uniref:hypothetical protein n=1 Tax=Bacillus cereus TaxID=1396 RepID=UPI00077865A9|nr:hypothetical protein [Bacillus cereus]KXY97521.1 hypothetical protein AT280_13730 [Bacillus cereus]
MKKGWLIFFGLMVLLFLFGIPLSEIGALIFVAIVGYILVKMFQVSLGCVIILIGFFVVFVAIAFGVDIFSRFF